MLGHFTDACYSTLQNLAEAVNGPVWVFTKTGKIKFPRMTELHYCWGTEFRAWLKEHGIELDLLPISDEILKWMVKIARIYDFEVAVKCLLEIQKKIARGPKAKIVSGRVVVTVAHSKKTFNQLEQTKNPGQHKDVLGDDKEDGEAEEQAQDRVQHQNETHPILRCSFIQISEDDDEPGGEGQDRVQHNR